MDIQELFENAKFKLDEVEYLNHYTNLESLHYILRNKSLKLSRIDKVNDLIEHSRMDVFEDRKGFVSCFTRRQKESFFFWKVYSHKQEKDIGIRISFPSEIASLNEFFFDPECTRPIPFTEISDIQHCSYNLEEDWGFRHFGFYNVVYIDDLAELKYEDTELKEFLKDCVTACRLSPEKHHLPCIVKTKEWDSEEEVRITVFLRPKGQETVPARTCFGNDIYPQPFFDNIYLKLTPSLLENCVFTISPFNSTSYNMVAESILRLASVSPSNIVRSLMAVRL